VIRSPGSTSTGIVIMPPTELTPQAQHALVAAFSAGLVLRPDAEHVRCSLSAAFAYHAAELWPLGDPRATPSWIAMHTDEILATVERLYSVAMQGFPGSDEYLERMAWLPELLASLDRSGEPTVN
jgi:hypothetical protein